MPDGVKITSDALHNQNCYEFLKNIELDSLDDNELGRRVNAGLQNNQYNPTFPYGQLYTDLLTYVENNSQKLGKLIKSIYDTKSGILKNTYDRIKPILVDPSDVTSAEHWIAEQISDKSKRINSTPSPRDVESNTTRFWDTFLAANYKPQLRTNIPSPRQYEYNKDSNGPQEYRWGTQAQRHQNEARISPTFKAYLAQKKSDDPNYVHLYVNNLARGKTDGEKGKESALTTALENLETGPDGPIFVITLPAENGFFKKDSKEMKALEDNPSRKAVHDELFNKATANQGDFYISASVFEKIKQNRAQNSPENVLFDVMMDDGIDSTFRNNEFKQLLDESFKTMGLENKDKLTPDEIKAVWFHFTKFAVPNYLISNLNVNGFNFTCKDGIDRGGVSSAFYNLMKSFETDKPMNEEEFKQALHAAPTIVKGRGMNQHAELIWSAVDQYVKANKDKLTDNKAWLVEWHALNCPNKKLDAMLNEKINDIHTKLETDPQPLAKQEAREVLKAIASNKSTDTHGKRLLLETAVITEKLISKPGSVVNNKLEALGDKIDRHNEKKITTKLYNLISFIKNLFIKSDPNTNTQTKNRIKSSLETLKQATNTNEETNTRNEKQVNDTKPKPPTPL